MNIRTNKQTKQSKRRGREKKSKQKLGDICADYEIYLDGISHLLLLLNHISCADLIFYIEILYI